MHAPSALLLATFAGLALCDKHYFFSGFFAGSTIIGVEFDDVAESLTLVNNITTDASDGSKWIALDVCTFRKTSTKLQNHAY